MMGGLSIHLFYGYHTYTRTCSVSFLFCFFSAYFSFLDLSYFDSEIEEVGQCFPRLTFRWKWLRKIPLILDATWNQKANLRVSKGLKDGYRFQARFEIKERFVFLFPCIFLFWPRYCWASKVKWAERRRIIFRSPEKKQLYRTAAWLRTLTIITLATFDRQPRSLWPSLQENS